MLIPRAVTTSSIYNLLYEHKSFLIAMNYFVPLYNLVIYFLRNFQKCKNQVFDSSDTYTGNRSVFSADLDNLVEGTNLITTDIKMIFWRLKNSIATREVTYSNIEAGYLVEALYSYI